MLHWNSQICGSFWEPREILCHLFLICWPSGAPNVTPGRLPGLRCCGSLRLRVQGAFPLPGSCHHGVVMCCAFLCFTPSCCWWPCKVAFGKDQRAEATQEGKGNSGAGSQPGQGLCWPQGWPRGAPHSQDSNFPALETCCAVYFDSLCVQMYVFTIVSGRGECLTLVFETELYFCL